MHLRRKRALGKINKPTLLLVATLAILATTFVFGIKQRIWADATSTTKIRFANALFCQRVSQAINDSLGDGKADGSDCANFNLYVSTSEIPNIQTLDIVQPENGWGSIDWTTQSISIGGQWVTVFDKLTSLSITNMHVNDISPLASLVGRLTYLNLSSNSIYDISALSSQKESLEFIDLSNNPLGDLRPLHSFTTLNTLKLQNVGYPSLESMFYPADVQYNPNTGEPLGLGKDQNGNWIYPTSSPLSKVLEVLDISFNPNLSSDTTYLNNACSGSLYSFQNYAGELALSTLYATNDNLNSDDLICISKLEQLNKLDVTYNHIGDFSSIRDKAFSELRVHSQSFARYTDSLDYGPLQDIFAEAAEKNYFSASQNATNNSIPKERLELQNAKFYEDDKVRFVNAAIAQQWAESPEPATVTIPSDSGAFANSKLEVFFTGQVVTFNDSNLCDSIYKQGADFSAFHDVNWNQTAWEPIVLTNACSEAKKQIAMKSGGTSYFVRLELDEINNGAFVDTTGLNEFTSLQVLSLQNNALDDISKLQDMYNMQQLWLGDNRLNNDDWWVITERMRGLSMLSVNNNQMSEIPAQISYLYRLGNLYLVSNGISDIAPLAFVPTLTVLDISKNSGITDITSLVAYNEDGSVQSATNPSILKSENTSLSALPSAEIIEDGFSNLVSLNLNSNQITDDSILNLEKADKLDELYLNNNSLTTTTGFSGLSKLKKLFLDNNKIVDVSGLTSLSRLAELHIAGNKIPSIAGLNTLPALATLDIKNQVLEGELAEGETAFSLPPVFSQAKSLTFSNISTFPSATTYTVENGTLNSANMTVSPTDSSKEFTVTIPDGGLSGTKITITSASDSPALLEQSITNNTRGLAEIAALSSATFTVSSPSACVAFLSADNGLTWTRLTPSTVSGNVNARSFAISSPSNTKINVFMVGDANGDGSVNVRDARKIVNIVLGNDTPSSLEESLGDVDNSSGINVRDVRAIINSVLGIKQLSW